MSTNAGQFHGLSLISGCRAEVNSILPKRTSGRFGGVVVLSEWRSARAVTDGSIRWQRGIEGDVMKMHTMEPEVAWWVRESQSPWLLGGEKKKGG